jgi:hypothetical protein
MRAFSANMRQLAKFLTTMAAMTATKRRKRQPRPA